MTALRTVLATALALAACSAVGNDGKLWQSHSVVASGKLTLPGKVNQ